MPQRLGFSPELDGRPGRNQIPGMRRQGGGFGFVMLLVVLAIVFFLAMRNFESVAPEATAIQKHSAQRRSQEGVGAENSSPQPSTSSSADSWAPAPPSRPNLETVDRNTTQHANDVQSALSQTN